MRHLKSLTKNKKEIRNNTVKQKVYSLQFTDYAGSNITMITEWQSYFVKTTVSVVLLSCFLDFPPFFVLVLLSFHTDVLIVH